MDSSSSSRIELQKVVNAEQGPSGGVGTSILMLNNDCLFHILSFLKLRELLRAEKVCERFKEVAQMIYRTYRVLDEDARSWNIEETEEIFCRVGRYIHTLKVNENEVEPFYMRPVSIDSILFARILDFIPQHCENLQSIHLTEFTFKEQESRDNMAAMCRNVKVARFRNCLLTDGALASMLKLNQLEVLEINQSETWDFLEESWINGEFLSSLTKNIREISLERNFAMNPPLFLKFCKDHPNLQSLNIKNCSWINSNFLQRIATYLIGLEELVISLDCVTSNQDNVALASMPKIKHLAVEGLFIENDIPVQLLLNLSAHDRLEYLKIERLSITPNVAKALAKFTKLKVLNLNRCEYNDSTLDLLSCTATLQQLHISDKYHKRSVTPSALERLIARCPAIEFINISGRDGFDDSSIPPILDIIEGRQHMLELRVGRYKFSMESLKKYVGNNQFKLKLIRNF